MGLPYSSGFSLEHRSSGHPCGPSGNPRRQEGPRNRAVLAHGLRLSEPGWLAWWPRGLQKGLRVPGRTPSWDLTPGRAGQHRLPGFRGATSTPPTRTGQWCPPGLSPSCSLVRGLAQLGRGW